MSGTRNSYTASRARHGVIDKIERDFVAAVDAHMGPIRLEV